MNLTNWIYGYMLALAMASAQLAIMATLGVRCVEIRHRAD